MQYDSIFEVVVMIGEKKKKVTEIIISDSHIVWISFCNYINLQSDSSIFRKKHGTIFHTQMIIKSFYHIRVNAKYQTLKNVHESPSCNGFCRVDMFFVFELESLACLFEDYEVR